MFHKDVFLLSLVVDVKHMIAAYERPDSLEGTIKHPAGEAAIPFGVQRGAGSITRECEKLGLCLPADATTTNRSADAYDGPDHSADHLARSQP